MRIGLSHNETFLKIELYTVEQKLFYHNKETKYELIDCVLRYYTTEVMCMVQPWSLLIGCEALRYRILVNCVPRQEHHAQSSQSTTSQRINPIPR